MLTNVPSPHARIPFLGILATILLPVLGFGAETCVKLAWDESSDSNIAGYRVHYGSESGAYTETVDAGTEVKAELKGLPAGSTYYCAVTAYNTLGLESDYSNEISFTVRPPAAERDTDGDGLSDAFEIAYGDGEDVDPLLDLDGDRLSALAEYFHGLDPSKPLRKPIMEFETMEIDGEPYVCLRYLVDPYALNFISLEIERRDDLYDPFDWRGGEMVFIGSQPSVEHPHLMEVLERSINPMYAQKMEYFRFKHQVITSAASPSSDGGS